MSFRGFSFSNYTFEPIAINPDFDLSSLTITTIEPVTTTPEPLVLVEDLSDSEGFNFNPNLSATAEAGDGFASASAYGYASSSSSTGGSSVSVSASSYSQVTDSGSFAFSEASVFDGTSTFSVSDFDIFSL